MLSLTLLLFASFAATCLSDVTSPRIKCGTGEHSCYNCLGRDYDNCEYGQTCCRTACFKIIDDQHELIAKGCWSEKTDEIHQVPTDNHARSYKTSVELPWANGEVIQGLGYFCRDDNCNAARRHYATALAVLAAPLLALLARA